MTEYAHNHPPACCCSNERESGGTQSAHPPTICPLCPEHGELAQLGNNNSPNAQRRAAGYPDLPAGVVVADLAYACCHQLVGRPHTDYCQAPNAHRELLGMTYEPQHHTSPEGTHPVHQCHPDRCGMWATQTTQPATQTSTPDTEARTGDFLEGARTLRATGVHHTPDGVHRTDSCHPVICGWPVEADSEPTPHATPTPGRCPECGHDLAATSDMCPNPDHRA